MLDGADALRKLGSIGKVVPAVTARVVDPMMNDVADGEVGEIVYRGSNMMLGYWQNPQGTQDAFRGGWFHSGDLVRRDDEGFLYVVDRAKDMIISGGENIYCAEVENVLYGHPRIAEAAVIGRADPKWGEVPVAVVVTVDGAWVPAYAIVGVLLVGGRPVTEWIDEAGDTPLFLYDTARLAARFAELRAANKELASLERRIDKLHSKIDAARTALADHDQSDYQGLAAETESIRSMESELEELEERWMELGESVE